MAHFIYGDLPNGQQVVFMAVIKSDRSPIDLALSSGWYYTVGINSRSGHLSKIILQVERPGPELIGPFASHSAAKAHATRSSQ
jgi:hypothetical protein